MTADVELLPLPKHMKAWARSLADDAQAYARANVEHHTAAQAAEIEALRAERDVLAKEATKYADKSGRLQAEIEALRAEVERLREALERIDRFTMSQFLSMGMMADACQETARAALQERGE